MSTSDYRRIIHAGLASELRAHCRTCTSCREGDPCADGHYLGRALEMTERASDDEAAMLAASRRDVPVGLYADRNTY